MVRGKGRQVIASEKLDRKEVRDEYERKVCERLGEARMTVGERIDVNVAFNLFNLFTTS